MWLRSGAAIAHAKKYPGGGGSKEQYLTQRSLQSMDSGWDGDQGRLDTARSGIKQGGRR